MRIILMLKYASLGTTLKALIAGAAMAELFWQKLLRLLGKRSLRLMEPCVTSPPLWWDGQRVTCLIPPGANPHNYQMKPSDRKALAKASLLLHNGFRVDPFGPENVFTSRCCGCWRAGIAGVQR